LADLTGYIVAVDEDLKKAVRKRHCDALKEPVPPKVLTDASFSMIIHHFLTVSGTPLFFGSLNEFPKSSRLNNANM
jgi:hypothetical protein